MTTAEELLEKSINHYREIMEKMHSVKTAMKSEDPAKIKILSIAIDTAQEKTHLIEQELDQFLRQTPQLRQSARFRDRLALVEEIIELTESCTPKVKDLMTINRNELKKIVGGMAIMDIYNSAPRCQRKGGLINSSS